jgi:hypothetical protein
LDGDWRDYGDFENERRDDEVRRREVWEMIFQRSKNKSAQTQAPLYDAGVTDCLSLGAAQRFG